MNNFYELLAILSSNLICFLTFFGVVITLFIKNDNKIDKNINAIHQEIKDFHERLLEIERRRK